MMAKDEELFFKHSFCYDCHMKIQHCKCRISNPVLQFAQFSRLIKAERKRVREEIKQELKKRIKDLEEKVDKADRIMFVFEIKNIIDEVCET